MKKIISLTVLLFLCSCQSYVKSRQSHAEGRRAFRDHALKEVAQQYEYNEMTL